MNKRKYYPKVAIDMFFVQGDWTKWFLGIITIVYVIQVFFAIKSGNSQDDFFVSSFVASNIYMFVIGIIAAYVFLPFYVRNGVTRRDYFKGAFLAAIGLSLTIMVYSLILTGLERLIINIGNLPLVIDNTSIEFFEKDEDMNLLGQIIKSIVVSPFISLESNWLISLVLTCLNFIVSYLIGWLIGTGYYRYGWLIGFGFIGIAIGLMMLWDYLWGSGVDIPIFGLILGSVVFIAIILRTLYALINRVAIRL